MALLYNVLFLWCVTLNLANFQSYVVGQPQVPCLFFFGDSLFDNGNNNNLVTQSKANYEPYGIDYPGGKATGRFCNGRNIPDLLAEHLGFPNPIPPFATASDSDILNGVNYASGGAGILDESGKHLGDNISLKKQIENHKVTISKLLERNKTFVEENISKCLYVINIGSNDFLNNYFSPQYYNSSKLHTALQFATSLKAQLSSQLKSLVDMQAQRVAIFSLGGLGCVPGEIARYPPDPTRCVYSISNAVRLFNLELKQLVDELNVHGKLATNYKFIYINTTSINRGIDPISLVLTGGQNACCKVSATSEAYGQCIPGSTPCSNRNNYVFFDAFHPTEIINIQTASSAYKSKTPLDSYPYDISFLIKQ